MFWNSRWNIQSPFDNRWNFFIHSPNSYTSSCSQHSSAFAISKASKLSTRLLSSYRTIMMSIITIMMMMMGNHRLIISFLFLIIYCSIIPNVAFGSSETDHHHHQNHQSNNLESEKLSEKIDPLSFRTKHNNLFDFVEIKMPSQTSSSLLTSTRHENKINSALQEHYNRYHHQHQYHNDVEQQHHHYYSNDLHLQSHHQNHQRKHHFSNVGHHSSESKPETPFSSMKEENPWTLTTTNPFLEHQNLITTQNETELEPCQSKECFRKVAGFERFLKLYGPGHSLTQFECLLRNIFFKCIKTEMKNHKCIKKKFEKVKKKIAQLLWDTRLCITNNL
ncbi:hypothetical protein SSS_07497 [Sarcoptes scabiei]|uniref:Uncharacterized protein n=1 Tax=Sarcoptes scabiei TaxID=52283 RepID=A0A834RAL1_SARSC|nr:hypothetical protein SSS_07497 [Sarcoptes scabiei]